MRLGATQTANEIDTERWLEPQKVHKKGEVQTAQHDKHVTPVLPHHNAILAEVGQRIRICTWSFKKIQPQWLYQNPRYALYDRLHHRSLHDGGGVSRPFKRWVL